MDNFTCPKGNGLKSLKISTFSTESFKRELLASSMAELLWKVGDKNHAVLAVPETSPVFEASVRFSMDGVTEKVD